jgi:KRAB domain-containing zinc finger protein
MESVNVKEELSVEFVLILPNKGNQCNLTKVKSEAELENEENSNRTDKFVCGICDKKFFNKQLLQQHKGIHEPKVECKICDKSLAVLSLKRHMKIHALKMQPNKFKCEKCEKTFLTRTNVKQHEKTHEKPFECDKCGKRFAKKLDLSEHLLMHLNSKAFQCNICYVKFTSNKNLQFHLRAKHEIGSKEFKCSECSFKSTTRKEILLHRSKVHRSLHCKICDQTYLHKNNFNDHLKAHENFDVDDGELKCKKCQSKFESFRGFQIHFKSTHENQPKNFECKTCKKKLSSAPNLNKHKLTHMKKSFFQCDHCLKSFQNKFNLLAHLVEKHVSSTKFFKCKICSYQTKSKGDLRKHLKIHNKTFKCPKCGKMFAQKPQLDRHSKTHG